MAPLAPGSAEQAVRVLAFPVSGAEFLGTADPAGGRQKAQPLRSQGAEGAEGLGGLRGEVCVKASCVRAAKARRGIEQRRNLWEQPEERGQGFSWRKGLYQQQPLCCSEKVCSAPQAAGVSDTTP